jgi:phospholipase/carboxylesterase
MSDTGDAVLDAVTRLLPQVLGTLDTLRMIARQMHPTRLADLVASIGDRDASLRAALESFRAADWPQQMVGFRDQVALAADLTLRACTGLREPGGSANGRFAAYRALRHHTRAIEALYPLATALPTIGRWFLNPLQRDDAALLERLGRPNPDTGVIHANNETGMRGGFSLYVPEYYDPATACPLVMALHGGAGHGRLFLWSWIREARGRGLIVVAPTATGDTWSLMDPDIDTAHIEQVLHQVRARWTVDPTRILLTGMSDGGTFTLLSGLSGTSSFTHLAPVAASFHPLLLTMADPRRTSGLPVYLVHGALDWMFPVEVARTANRALTAAGARVSYHEVADLSHAYPVDENDRIIDWLLAPRA